VVTADVELERLLMSLEQNFITDEVRANGFGGVDGSGSRGRSSRSR
jgi:hypothetical protein